MTPINARASEHHQVGVSYLNKSRNFPFKLLKGILLSGIIHSIDLAQHEFEFLDSYVLLFKSSLVHFGRSPTANALFNHYVAEADHKELTTLLKLLLQVIARLLSVCPCLFDLNICVSIVA